MASEQAKRTPRLPPEIRRRQILDATRGVIVAEGYAELTLDAVARAAGITRPVIYDQFGDLEGLVAEFIDDIEEQALAGVGGALPDPHSDVAPDQILADAIGAFLNAVRADPDVWRIVLLPADGTPLPVRERTERRRREIAAGVAEIFEIIAERRSILAGVDSYTLGRVIVAAAEDMARLVLEKPRRYTPRRIGRAIGGIARLLPEVRAAGGERSA